MSRADTVGIVGAGRFGTALAHVVAGAGRDALLWSRDPEVVAEINRAHKNPRIAAHPLHEQVRATGDPGELAAAARMLVLAVSSAEVVERAEVLGEVVTGGHVLVHAVTGLVSPGDRRVSEVLRELTPVLRIGALAGPTMWGDLMSKQFTSLVVASDFDEVSREARRLLGSPPVLRMYGGADLIGVELASALSGAYTVAVGMADALDIGIGVRSVLVTRALAEASRLGAAAGAEARTFTGLAGLGNLLVQISRKPEGASPEYQLGSTLGRGGAVPDKGLCEGARAALAGDRLARRLGVRAPVLAALAAVLGGRMSVRAAAQAIAEAVAPEE
ncbi:NAD(P)H-dependent glycerol-3-phosphate dehydrogenase [Haliangium sp.]|uniref:NAD(P)H-dependent glycerol-3-phosphate dehydrogenase n=1 Tax=Haliangium sp. TaxID=2663208 RepID=UPI003D106E56